MQFTTWAVVNYTVVALSATDCASAWTRRLASDPGFAQILESDPQMYVTPAWAFTAPPAVVTLLAGSDGNAPPVAVAFLVDTSATGGRIELIPEPVGFPEARPAQGTTISPGRRIEVPGVPVEGGARAHVNGVEVPVVVDHERFTMSFTVPHAVAGEIAISLSVASPELPGAFAFAYVVDG